MVECNIQITEAALFYCHTGGKKTEDIHTKKLDSANLALFSLKNDFNGLPK